MCLRFIIIQIGNYTRICSPNNSNNTLTWLFQIVCRRLVVELALGAVVRCVLRVGSATVTDSDEGSKNTGKISFLEKNKISSTIFREKKTNTLR